MHTIPLPSLNETVRQDFPILNELVRGNPLTYLDNAATAQKPTTVIEAVDRYYRESNANIHRGVHFLSQKATAQYDQAREKVRKLLNAGESAEVIFTKGCTEGINLVAAGIKLEPGDEILVSTMEHHSNIVPWQLAAERTGAKVIPIPVTDSGEIDLDSYEQYLMRGKPKAVAIVHISNSMGTVNPVKWMVAQAHAYGAVVLVDGAQAGPHVRIDVQDLDADFYTLSCHKIYAPTGVGVLYGKRAHLEALPPYQGGGDMIRTVSFDGSTYAELPGKFEAGTPNIAGVIGLGAAIDYLESLGGGSLEDAFAAIQRRELELSQHAEKLLREIPGLRMIGTARDKTGIVSFVLEGAHPHDIGTILDSDGIAIRAGHHCCMPLMKRFNVPATARASFAFYNTIEEAERLAVSVRKVAEMFA
ncbi:MAG: cysteine desulfurase [Armatimonadetes bacterium]|nr:cysteine desulfurase [Armatimonadota bacterium]